MLGEKQQRNQESTRTAPQQGTTASGPTSQNIFESKRQEVDLELVVTTSLKLKRRNDHKIDDRLISLEDFSLYRYDRSRQGGGVALYVRNTVRSKPREDLSNKSLEWICLEVEPPNSNPFIVIAWYRPPSEPNSCFDSLHENQRAFLMERRKKSLSWETRNMTSLIDTLLRAILCSYVSYMTFLV